MNHIKKHTPTKKKSTTTANLKKHRRVPHQQHGAPFSTTATTTTRNIRTASRNKRCVQDAVDMVNEYTQWKRNQASQRDPFVFQSREMTIDHAFTPPGKATATHLHPHHHHDINRHVGRGATTVVDSMKHLTHHLYPQPQRIIPHHNHPTNNNNNNRHNTLFHTAFHPTRAVWAPQKRNTTASGVSGSNMFDESFINMNNGHQRDQTLSFKQHEPLSENGLENYQAASTFNANIYAAETKPSFHSRELTNNGGERNSNNNNNNNNQNNTNMTSNNSNNNKNDTNNQRQQRQTKQSTTTSTSSRTSRRATKNNENNKNDNNTKKDNTTTMNTKQQAVGGNDTMGQNADHFAI